MGAKPVRFPPDQFFLRSHKFENAYRNRKLGHGQILVVWAQSSDPLSWHDNCRRSVRNTFPHRSNHGSRRTDRMGSAAPRKAVRPALADLVSQSQRDRMAFRRDREHQFLGRPHTRQGVHCAHHAIGGRHRTAVDAVQTPLLPGGRRTCRAKHHACVSNRGISIRGRGE
jgi:hypothetical protein